MSGAIAEVVKVRNVFSNTFSNIFSRQSRTETEKISGRLYGCRRYDYMEVIGTTPWMVEVELRRDTHMDVSGRVVSGTKTEQQSRMPKPK